MTGKHTVFTAGWRRTSRANNCSVRLSCFLTAVSQKTVEAGAWRQSGAGVGHFSPSAMRASVLLFLLVAAVLGE